jgi:serine/threonine protein kinase
MPDAKTLISNLLQFDPAERYDAHEALNYQFHSFTYQSIHSTLIKSYSRDPKLLQ